MSDLLGMPIGTATHRLRQTLMFSMAVKLSENICFRCGSIIETMEEFSIEHKESWRFAADPVVAFFDPLNISFSHRRCNYSAPKRYKKWASKKERHAASNIANQVTRVQQRKRWRGNRRAAGLPYT